jgi:FkbM family methyltransferase
MRKWAKRIVQSNKISNDIATNMLNKYRIQKILRIFYFKDFKLIHLSKFSYRLIFNDKAGYLRAGYTPSFKWDPIDDIWKIYINSAYIRYSENPLFELINELRGYMLFGDLQFGDIVIDAGPAGGLQSCFFSRCVGSEGRVFCIEPLSEAAQRLYHHVQINHIDNIEIVKKALYSRETRMSFSQAGGGSALCRVSTGNEVETISLKTLIDQYNIDKTKIKLIKLDIEGSEFDVLDDILKLVAENDNIIVAIASYHERDGTPSYKYIEQKGRERNNIFVKTLYPYHTTTFIANRSNKCVSTIDAYPSYQETKKRVWYKTELP